MVEKTIVVDGSNNLYRVAARQYNDTLKFIALLQDNFLPSPFIIQPQLIKIPDSPTTVGGKPNQPTGKGTGIIPAEITYPYTQTTTLEDDGIVTFQYTNGTVVSKTFGVGNTEVSQIPIVILLSAVTTVTVTHLTPTTLIANWDLVNNDLTIQYQLQISPTGEGNWTDVGIKVYELLEQVSDLTANTAYDLRVVPSNSIGNSLATPPITSIVTPLFSTAAG